MLCLLPVARKGALLAVVGCPPLCLCVGLETAFGAEAVDVDVLEGARRAAKSNAANHSKMADTIQGRFGKCAVAR